MAAIIKILDYYIVKDNFTNKDDYTVMKQGHIVARLNRVEKTLSILIPDGLEKATHILNIKSDDSLISDSNVEYLRAAIMIIEDFYSQRKD